MQPQQLVQLTQLVQKANKRINVATNLTFYSRNDLWYYFTVNASDEPCDECSQHDNKLFLGISLRSMFPWHTINDENIVKPNVHPNCRCFMVRALDVPLEAQELFEE